jgi:hypothetical protein
MTLTVFIWIGTLLVAFSLGYQDGRSDAERAAHNTGQGQ